MTAPTRNFTIVLSLLAISSLIIDASYAFNKCCPPGEVFTGTLKVNCAPAPPNVELFFVNDNGNGYPICEKPEYIATTPLDQLNSMNFFVQNTSCIEILHEQFTPQNVPILVHCKSNEDRNEKEQLVSLQSLLKSRLNVRRCCSNNQVFNVMTGNCESSVNVNEDDFLTFFNFIVKEKLQSQNVEIISISKDFFECPNSTAMFTYEIDAEDVLILDESLMVKVKNPWKNQIVENFTITEWDSCLEVTPDFRSKQRIIVRVCRDEKLCQDGNCVKKCSKKDKPRFACQPDTNFSYESNLTFYEKISNITGTPRSVTEYGVMFGYMKCPKGNYLEFMENTYGITSDGRLKLLSDKLLPQDIYCLDMFVEEQNGICEENLYALICFPENIEENIRRLQGNFTRDRNHGKRFLSYCLYAWGLPMFITIFAILDDQILILPDILRPHFDEFCWFRGHGEIFYFRDVTGIQLVINMIFFILTAKQCNKVKEELKKVTTDQSDPRNKQFLANKSKFIMNVKLFIVMGISWMGEIVSALIENYAPFKHHKRFFYPMDILNCLQGLLIFILFVVKRRVHQALKKRLFDEKKKFDRVTPSLQDPFKMRKSVSNSTLTSTFAVSSIP
ncbi:G-protein coupled receptor Mth2 [Apis cerana cerana]|uniref:G-protein coupled receptor Mth2 n=1 Tax=Apis cerana cerana TaxID=94128 RepID=A0A2A3EGU8_APICC|nr:G-protein coupled receptor Mth2 [Apis cerana cerana]